MVSICQVGKVKVMNFFPETTNCILIKDNVIQIHSLKGTFTCHCFRICS